MLKTISAALIATSLIAAPAMSATIIKTERGPVTKTVIVKPSVANSRAQLVVVKKHRHHRHGFHNHRHGHGNKVIVIKKHHH